jgi:mono/diheme cytochrome c family protein
MGRGAFLTGLLLGGAALAGAAQAQFTLTGTAGIGPFTQAQVDAGRPAYNAACGACHGQNLTNGTHRTALTGPGFIVGWGNRSTAEYFRYVRTRMPHREPNSLPVETYAAIIAYILSANGGRPGEQALTPETDVRIGSFTDGIVREELLVGQ